MPSTRPRAATSAESEREATCPAPTADPDRAAWLVRIDDLMVDARTLPRDMQEELASAGHIPHVAAGGEG